MGLGQGIVQAGAFLQTGFVEWRAAGELIGGETTLATQELEFDDDFRSAIQRKRVWLPLRLHGARLRQPPWR